ncbi:MAG: 50S ribosomal protein L4 [Dongiaceae bacterium]
MKQALKTLDNKDAGEFNAPADIFGLKPRRDILSRVVNWQLAKKQAGTHKTKTVSDIAGTTKKPWAQKGTGRARQGSLRNAQFRGGATIFGPLPRSHAFTLSRKFRQLGLKMALSSKLAEGNVIFLKEAALPEAKTGKLAKSLEKLGASSALLIGGEKLDANLAKAAANLETFNVLPTMGANVYDILRCKKLLITTEAVELLQARFKNSADKVKAAKPAKAAKPKAEKPAKAAKAKKE